MQIANFPSSYRSFFRNQRLSLKAVEKRVKAKTWLLHGNKRDHFSSLGWKGEEFSYSWQRNQMSIHS
jgi:hypothetical protein